MTEPEPISERDAIAANRELWDAWTGLHLQPTATYDVDGFVADPAGRPFDSIVRDVVGDVDGCRLLHLQCHFGLDTLRFALLGAQVTGIDFSPEAVAAARVLSERAGIPGTFVESDVRALPADVPEGAFDVVFTSYGTITWLPDLRDWARSITTRLAPGGRFHIIDMHPTLWIFDEEAEGPRFPIRYPYFSREVMRFDMHGSYAAPDADYHAPSYSWQHTFEEIVGSLLAEGLVLESLREYPKVAWKHAPFMVQDAEGFWTLPPDMPEVPLMFSLTARKAAD
jgi:SAM-dependent methyltransferase